MMDKKKTDGFFERMNGLRVGMLGDFCLDVYWHADMRKSQLSRETPHFPLPVVRERMQPGGAGNVACNLAALQPAKVTALSVLGQDWRGAELMRLLSEAGIDTGLLWQTKNRVTNGYIKPMRKGITDIVYEDPRLDFENHEALSREGEELLLEALRRVAPGLDVLCVCDQMAFGCVTEKVRQEICRLGAQGLPVFVDSRDRIGLYSQVIVKPNEVELCRTMGEALNLEEDALAAMARQLQAKSGRPMMVTLGERGCLVLEDGEVSKVRAYPVKPPVDICGAGDTFMAAAALFYGAGASLREAAEYATYSASLTVQKLHMTGTTTREELVGRMLEAQ